MISLALAFLAGGLAACFLPDRVQGVVRGAWGWVWARIRPLPAPVAPVQARFGQPVPQPLVGSPMVAKRIDWPRAIGNVARFLWRWKWAILVVLLFIFTTSVLRGCVQIPFGESREHAQIRAEMAEEEARTQVRINGRDAIIHDIGGTVAAARVTLQHLQEQGHAEIAAVTPPVETPLDASLVGAWRSSLGRLRLYPEANSAGANPSGSSTQS